MKIHFTKKELFALMKALYLADWFANSNHDNDTDKDMGIEKLLSKVYEIANKEGLSEYVDEYEGEFMPNRLIEEHPDIVNRIKDYNDEHFWTELADQLGLRDFIKANNLSKTDGFRRLDMNQSDYEKLCTSEDKWNDEFEKHGLSRITTNTD